MMHEAWNANALTCNRSASKSAPCSPIKPIPGPIARSVPFHVAHKVPVGDTPYVSAKRVQAAINAGDRVDSALKDMAIVMKQQNRSVAPAAVIRPGAGVVVPHTVGLVQEVREIGRLNRAPDSPEAQASTDPEGARLQQKRTKMARSKGRKFQVTLEQEATRLLGNLGWALMQKEKYAEAAYRRAIQIGANRNKMCNLGICLTKQERIAEAKDTLKRARQVAADVDSLRSVDALLKAFERAQEMLRDLELKL